MADNSGKFKISKDALNIDTTLLASFPATTTTIVQDDADKINEMQRILLLIIDNAKKS